MFANFECPAPQRVETRLGPVTCAIAGEGIPLVTLHGGMGGHDQSWVLARALVADPAVFRIIAVARPGYPGTPSSGTATPAEQADRVTALLDVLELDSAFVAAISAGGPAAIAFALRYPARCRGLVLVSTATGRMQSPPNIQSRLKAMSAMAFIPGAACYLRRKVAKDPAAALMRSLPDRAAAEAVMAHPHAGALFRLFQLGIFDKLAGRIAGTRQDIECLSHLSPLALGTIQVPVLTIHGAEDVIVPSAHADAVTAPGVRHLRLAGAGHVALFSHMDAIRSAVADFLPR